MPPAGRPTSLSNSRRRAAGPGRAPVAFYRATGPDLAARLRAFQRPLRSRVERRDALLDIMRAVNASLDPEKVGEFIVERAATWIPAPGWAVVAAEPAGQLTIVASRELDPEAGLPLEQIAGWVMHHGEEFLTANLRADERIRGRRGRDRRRSSTRLPWAPDRRRHRAGSRAVVAPAAAGRDGPARHPDAARNRRRLPWTTRCS